MASTYHAIVWIDHREAKVFHFDATSMDKLVLHPDNPTQHLHHKANSIGSGHAPEDQQFLHHVVEAITDATAVLITGPGSEKDQLMKHIEAHDPTLKAKIKGIEKVDHPTDGELVAHARNYFKADHQQPHRG